jgi:hypothetical protein
MILSLTIAFRIHFSRSAVKRIPENLGIDLVTNLLARCYVKNLLPGPTLKDTAQVVHVAATSKMPA